MFGSKCLDPIKNGRQYYIMSPPIKSNYPYHRKNLPNVSLCYALKANSDKYIVDLVVKNDCGFDVASENEMKSVIEAGVDRSKLVYAHPTRPMEHLKYALENHARDH